MTDDVVEICSRKIRFERACILAAQIAADIESGWGWVSFSADRFLRNRYGAANDLPLQWFPFVSSYGEDS